MRYIGKCGHHRPYWHSLDFWSVYVWGHNAKGRWLCATLTEKIEDFAVVFLLPVYFAYTGLRTQVGLLDSGDLWLFCLLIIGVATVGEFGGSAVAARITGPNWREASALGVLMNTRGLMELIILNIGLDLGVISPALFAMMVLMAIVTTIMTTPALAVIYPLERLRAELLAPETETAGLGYWYLWHWHVRGLLS